jgi:hypothetical protein
MAKRTNETKHGETYFLKILILKTKNFKILKPQAGPKKVPKNA